MSSWRKLSFDNEVVHNTGDENVGGVKSFTDSIKTTSDNSMINGGGNNGDIALIKKLGSSGFLGIGSAQLGNAFRIKRSNNAAISPYDTFTDIFIVDVNGVVKVGTQQDLVPLDKNVVHNSGRETVNGDKTFTSALWASAGVELQGETPFIDFHFNNDAGDYTSRIIEIVKGTLSINGVNMNSGTISGTLNGNSSSTTKLAIARNINGVGFDGTSDITVDPVTRQISTATDLFTLANGFYFNAGVASTNKPAAASNYFVVEVIQTSTNGFMRLIDSNGLSFWTTKSANAWGAWHQDADDSTVVHNTGDENIGGNKAFNGVTTVNSAVSSNTIKKSITTSAPINLNFSETAFGVMVYASAGGNFYAEGVWKPLATLPAEITAPTQIVIMSDVDWAGVGGVTYRLGVGLKISIKPSGEIMYKCTSLKDNDNTNYNVTTTFDLSTYWSK